MSASACRGFGQKTTPTWSRDCARPDGRADAARVLASDRRRRGFNLLPWRMPLHDLIALSDTLAT
jgi:hypothetical protein